MGEEILAKIVELLPESASIVQTRFEGASAVVFTDSLDFLVEAHKYLSNVAKELKLRIEARASGKLLLKPQEAEEKIREILKDAGVTEIFFERHRSVAVIEVERPSRVFQEGMKLIQEIKAKTAWSPVIYRKPPLKSEIITTVRSVWTKRSKERAEFLHEVGLRIYSEGRPLRWVRTSFFGGAREVGRSSIFVQTPESRILLDCGINVASKAEAYPYLDAPEFDLRALDAVVITHAHLDHSGFLPYLYRLGYKGPAYMTPPTLFLSVLLQLDFIEVNQREGTGMLYTSKEIEEEVLHAILIPYEEVTTITPDIRLTFYDAGHILGSAMVHLHFGEGFYNLLYTGDLKFAETRLHEPPKTTFPRLEALIIESTYGGSDDIQKPRQEAEEELLSIINMTLERGGKVLIPVLGAGRAQEIMLIVEEAVRKGKLPKDVKVFVDGIVWDTTAIYTTFPEFLHRSIRAKVFAREENPLLSKIFLRVGSQKEREKVALEEGPCIILATSGMLTGGPSVYYFEALAPYPQNSIIFVNYQAVGSLGRKVQRRPKEIVLNSGTSRKVVPLNMEVYTIEGFSAHSDRNELLSFVKALDPRPQVVITVHGEPKKTVELAKAIRQELGVATKVPNNLDAIRLK